MSKTGGSESDLVIIGAGMAATRLLETLRARGDQRRITVFGEEHSLPYNRILLSPLLAGEQSWPALQSHDAEWYRRNNIDLRIGQRVVAVDCEKKRLRCADGSELGYRQLVFATGSRAALPPIAGIRLPGVSVFRNREDVEALRRAAQAGGPAVVLGGGLLGIEAAVALAAQGMYVSLVQRGRLLMNRQLDETAAGWLQAALEQRGITVISGVAPEAVEGESRAEAVRLANGHRLPARAGGGGHWD
jgi:nitrite reductase (NADH) large subunit